MHKILVLPGTKRIKRIEEFMKSNDFQIIRGSYTKIAFKVGNGDTRVLHDGIDIREFDFVWLTSTWSTRDLGYAVACYLDKYEVPHTRVEFASSKLTDHMAFAISGLTQPHTFHAYSKYLINNLEELEDFCGYPMVMKPKKGNGGKKTTLINDRDELTTAVRGVKVKDFLFQEFIPNRFDWGINVADGNVVAASKRFRKAHGFLNNACQGAEEIFVELKEVPEEVRTYAKRAAKSLNLNWTRADIIYNDNTDDPTILELNRYPGMTVDSPEVNAFADFLDTRICLLD